MPPPSALRKGIDYIVPFYRDNAALFLHGLPMHYALLHWMGDERGNAIPADLSMSSICLAIGTQTLHAVGIAWAFKLRKEDRAVLCFLGDGATSTGDFHEAMNLAAVQKVPCVFCCVNNQWAISTHRLQQTASETFAQKALAYGMPTVQVDGNDVFAVFKAHRDALARAARARARHLSKPSRTGSATTRPPTTPADIGRLRTLHPRPPAILSCGRGNTSKARGCGARRTKHTPRSMPQISCMTW